MPRRRERRSSLVWAGMQRITCSKRPCSGSVDTSQRSSYAQLDPAWSSSSQGGGGSPSRHCESSSSSGLAWNASGRPWEAVNAAADWQQTCNSQQQYSRQTEHDRFGKPSLDLESSMARSGTEMTNSSCRSNSSSSSSSNSSSSGRLKLRSLKLTQSGQRPRGVVPTNAITLIPSTQELLKRLKALDSMGPRTSKAKREKTHEATQDVAISKRTFNEALQHLRRYCSRCSSAVRLYHCWGRDMCFCGGSLSAPQGLREEADNLEARRKAKAALATVEQYKAQEMQAVSSDGLRAAAKALRAKAKATDALATLRDAEDTLRQAEAGAAAAVQAAPHLQASQVRKPMLSSMQPAAQNPRWAEPLPTSADISHLQAAAALGGGATKRGSGGNAARPSRAAKTITWQQQKKVTRRPKQGYASRYGAASANSTNLTG